jgi:hypothetical protein
MKLSNQNIHLNEIKPGENIDVNVYLKLDARQKTMINSTIVQLGVISWLSLKHNATNTPEEEYVSVIYNLGFPNIAELTNTTSWCQI